jgi:hypothetical protein
MAPPPLHLLLGRLGRFFGALALILLLLSPGLNAPALAAAPSPNGPAARSRVPGGTSSQPTRFGARDLPAALPLAEGWTLGKVWSSIRHGLGNRRRMLQVATIGMCIGLYIMMRK